MMGIFFIFTDFVLFFMVEDITSMEMELSDVRRILKQNLLLILSIIIIAVVSAGLVSSFLLKPVYEGKATLLVKKNGINQNQIEVDDLIASEKLVKTFAEIVKSRMVREKVINQMQLNMTSEQLLEKMSVQADNETLITTITVRDHDRVHVVTITNMLAKTAMQTWNEIMQIENVMMIDEAKQEYSMNPVGPRLYLNMAIAFAVSAMLGIGIAVIRELLDHTLKTEEEIEEKFGIPVLGVIPIMKK